MSTFDSLTWAFEDWFDTAMQELPAALREQAKREFVPISWDGLSGDQRRSLALQLDYQHDPATEKDQDFWFTFFANMRKLKDQLAEWMAVAAPTAIDLEKKEKRLKDLQRELARMGQLAKKEQGDYYPAKPLIEGTAKLAVRYIAYPKAICRLIDRLGATPEELALWIWLGPDTGGLTAYVSVNELDPPPRFHFATGGDPDYVAALMPCWFEEKELSDFKPAERFITGAALLKRWSDRPGLKPEPFIQAKICESRLDDLHPVFGGTTGTFGEQPDWPALDTGLFSLSKIKAVEAEDFDDATGAKQSNTTVAKASKLPPRIEAEPRSDIQAPQVGSRVRLEARKLATQQRHKGWQIAYRKSKNKYPDKSDVWHAAQIAKQPVAAGKNAQTIRKLMKPKK